MCILDDEGPLGVSRVHAERACDVAGGRLSSLLTLQLARLSARLCKDGSTRCGRPRGDRTPQDQVRPRLSLAPSPPGSPRDASLGGTNPRWPQARSLTVTMHRFVPFVVPRHRRLQTFSVFLWTTALPLSLGIFCILWCALSLLCDLASPCLEQALQRVHLAHLAVLSCSRSSFPPLWPLVIGYLTWVFLIDQAPMRGGRPQAWLRKSRVWEWFAGYYPVRCAPFPHARGAVPPSSPSIELAELSAGRPTKQLDQGESDRCSPLARAGAIAVTRTRSALSMRRLTLARPLQSADLPPDQRYVFGYHPHGVIGMGAIANFGTDATGFSRLFPGIKPHLLTLASNFKLPLYRELLLALGISSVSMKSCQNILRQGARIILRLLPATRVWLTDCLRLQVPARRSRLSSEGQQKASARTRERQT